MQGSEKENKSKKRKYTERSDSDDADNNLIQDKKMKSNNNRSKSSKKIIFNQNEKIDDVPKENSKTLSNDKEFRLLIDDTIPNPNLIPNEEHNSNRPKISSIYYINANKLTVDDLKNGRRIFNNKTELSEYKEFKEHFLEFRQLLFPNLLLNEDFTENLKEEWTMESAIFSTFCYEDDFIEPLINKYKIKSLVIKHEENSKDQIIEKNNLLTFIHPKIDYTLKWGKFHSKLTIFKFPSFLRVIIPSANLTSGDWYYWGQIIWFQDFPLKNTTSFITSDFEIYFEKMLNSILPTNYSKRDFFKNLNIKFSDYDFSDTVVDLIASTSGRFSQTSKDEFGVGRLKHLSKNYTNSKKSMKGSFNNNKLIIQCSSIGKSLKEKFLSDLCSGFLCNDSNSNTKRDPQIDIIYPTVDYVNSFPLGKELSGCLFLGKEVFMEHRKKFKNIEMLPGYEKCKTVFHSKFFISCVDKNVDENIDEISDNTIFYFGSHNFSVAAWGNLEKGDTQVSMANYELGIIFNPIKLRYEEKQKIYRSLIMNINSKYYTNKDVAWIAEYF